MEATISGDSIRISGVHGDPLVTERLRARLAGIAMTTWRALRHAGGTLLDALDPELPGPLHAQILAARAYAHMDGRPIL
jgi:hypothetical protein